MITTINYYTPKRVKWTLFTILIVLLANPCAYSQYKEYIGIEGGFGARSFTTNSNIPQIDQLTTIKAGGSLGIVYGTPIFKFPVVIGLYFQSVEEKQTIDLFTVQTGVNLSILPFLGIKKSPVNIYTLANLEYQGFTFRGTYSDLPSKQRSNGFYSHPLMGRKKMLNANLGVGIEIKLRDDFAFVHLFMEAKKSYHLSSRSTSAFNNTTITNGLALNIGIRVGTVR